MPETSPVITVASDRPLGTAARGMLARLADWAAGCVERYTDAPATDVHDQLTYTTGWEPLLTRRPDDALLAFLRSQRDRVHQHYRETDKWHHGYWRMHEVHHGTEHFELFLGMMVRLDPHDAATVDAFVDMAEHMGNWSRDVPDWFDWDRGLFHSMYFGTDGLRTTDAVKLNVADHWRMVNLALIAHEATSDERYLRLAAAHADCWVDAINRESSLPIALTQDGPVIGMSETETAAYRGFAGEAMPDDDPVSRAENLLASNAVNAMLTLGHKLDRSAYFEAAGRVIDTLLPCLDDPDADALADAIRRFRRVTGSTRFDAAVDQAVAKLAPQSVRSLSFTADTRAPQRAVGVGKRTDTLTWHENGRPRRHSVALLALAAEMHDDTALAAQAVNIADGYLQLALEADLPDGRHHGCAARTVSAVARGHGRCNHVGVVTGVLSPLLECKTPRIAAALRGV